MKKEVKEKKQITSSQLLAGALYCLGDVDELDINILIRIFRRKYKDIEFVTLVHYDCYEEKYAYNKDYNPNEQIDIEDLADVVEVYPRLLNMENTAHTIMFESESGEYDLPFIKHTVGEPADYTMVTYMISENDENPKGLLKEYAGVDVMNMMMAFLKNSKGNNYPKNNLAELVLSRLDLYPEFIDLPNDIEKEAAKSLSKGGYVQTTVAVPSSKARAISFVNSENGKKLIESLKVLGYYGKYVVRYAEEKYNNNPYYGWVEINVNEYIEYCKENGLFDKFIDATGQVIDPNARGARKYPKPKVTDDKK